ncbi:Hsr recombination casette protein [Helicobacter mustelae]|uniref:Hsr recombination cassette protein n=1 Tax=Helicobacter mustelae TaxID=217 RepID=UPI000DFE31C6|nr:Hsr recombination cassette protein [Helicobacter mustelae]STP12757.1 Hsr recombination casette protein [Helicobacter mustelae]
MQQSHQLQQVVQVKPLFSTPFSTLGLATNLGNLIQAGGLGGANNANARFDQIQSYLDKFGGNSASANATGMPS